MAKAVVEQIADQIFTQLRTVQPDVVTAFGRRALEENARHNRVVCVPLGAPIVSEEFLRPGDRMYTNVGRPLYVRQFQHEWHCHGLRADGDENDFGATELLYLDTLRAVRFVTHASCQFSEETWTDQQDQADSYERFGSVIVFKSQINVPIWDARSAQKALTGDPPFVVTKEFTNDI